MKFVKGILRWLMTNWIIVVSLVLCLASLGCLYYIQGAGSEFNDTVAKRVGEADTIEKLGQTQIELPPEGLGQPPVKKTITVNRKAIEDITHYFGKLRDESNELHDYVVGVNEQNHPPFMAGLFPEPSQNTAQALDARVRYRNSLKEMFGAYSAADYPQLDAKPGLTPADWRDTLNQDEQDFLAAHGKTTTALLTPEENESLQEHKAMTLKNMLIDYAKKTHLFAQTDINKPNFPFDIAAWTAVGKARPTDSDLWEGQMTLWILGDVARAIGLANHVDNPDTNVMLAPIKRLVRANVIQGYPGGAPGGIVDTGAYDPQYLLSPTGRASHPTYDIRYVELEMVVDWKLLPAFFDALSQVNFMTVVKINTVTDVDEYTALTNGMVYGSGDAVDVDMLIETIWVRDKWLIKLMPAEVQKARGIAPGAAPASSAALTTTIAGPVGGH